MRSIAGWLLTLAALSLPVPITAQDQLPPAPYAYRQIADPMKEAAARDLMHTLRCVTCQGQSIADSDAAMAGDMRHLVRSRIAAGESAEQVRAWLITRYGDYISYQPSISSLTWPLYLVPLVLAVLAGSIVWRRIARRPATEA